MEKIAGKAGGGGVGQSRRVCRGKRDGILGTRCMPRAVEGSLWSGLRGRRPSPTATVSGGAEAPDKGFFAIRIAARRPASTPGPSLGLESGPQKGCLRAAKPLGGRLGRQSLPTTPRASRTGSFALAETFPKVLGGLFDGRVCDACRPVSGLGGNQPNFGRRTRRKNGYVRLF